MSAKLIKVNGEEIAVQGRTLLDIKCQIECMPANRFLSFNKYHRNFVKNNKNNKNDEDKFYKLEIGDNYYFICFDEYELTISVDGARFFPLDHIDKSIMKNKIASAMFDCKGNLIHFAEDPDYTLLIEVMKDLGKNGVINYVGGSDKYSFSSFFYSMGEGKSVNFSCICLSLLIYKNKTDKDIINSVLEIQNCLLDGRIEILDSKSEHYINLNFQKVTKIPLGYRKLSDTRYHRAGTVLIRDNETGICYILGQDEGQYFGCELPSKDVKTLEKAFLDLTPKILRNYSPSSYLRQGEWFVLNIEDEKPIKSLTKVHEAELATPPLKLNIDIEESLILKNREPSGSFHYISDCSELSENDAYIYEHKEIDGDNCYIVKVLSKSPSGISLFHEKGEHEPIDLLYDTWYAIIENRAVQSVSLQGLD